MSGCIQTEGHAEIQHKKMWKTMVKTDADWNCKCSILYLLLHNSLEKKKKGRRKIKIDKKKK